MALIDTSIYNNAPQSILRAGLNGYDSAMRSNVARAQRMDADTQRKQREAQIKQEEAKRIRQQAFQENLSGLIGASGEYGHTPEGQRDIFDRMAKAGFGQEMIGLMGGIPDNTPTLKNTVQPWHASSNGSIFNSETGEFRTKPSEKADTSKTNEKKIDPIAEARLAETKRLNDARIAAMNRQGNQNSPPIGGALANRSLLSDWAKSRFDYEKMAKPYLALKAIKDSPSYGTGVGDQSMIDKIIMIETGRVPTEAQYFQFAHNLGIDDKIDRVTGRLKSGAILGEDARRNIEAQADEQMKIAHSAYDTDYSQAEGMAKQNNVDPSKVLRKGGYYDEVGKKLSNLEQPNQTASKDPAKIARAKEYMALPPDSPYRTPAHDKAAKAILGIQ